MTGETSSPHRVLHLIVEGFPPARLRELTGSAGAADDVTEIFQLTEVSAREALEKIFAADTVAVWGAL
jgi:hypothetical protein